MTDPALDLPFGAEPEALSDPAPVEPRSDAHLLVLNRYRLELAQGLRCVSAVSGHLAIITETGDPHGVFDGQIDVLDTLVRQVGNTLTCLRNLVDSKGTA